MSRSSNGNEDPSGRDRAGLRLFHALIALGAMALGLPLALVGSMAMLGALGENPWIRAAAAGVVLVVAPLLLADRLLPKDPQNRRPGLVRDVLACSWAGAAAVFVVLAGTLTATPLRAEAARLETAGWDRAAWIGRWMAGPAPASAEAQPTALALDQTAAPEPTPADAPSPESAGSPIPADSVSDTATLASAAVEPEPTEPETETETEPTEPERPEVREYSPAELFESYAPAVVSIRIGHGGFHSGGTGFFIDDRGTLATNHHVIDDAREVRIKLLDGTELDRVELLVSDPEVDLALLRVDLGALEQPPGPTLLGDSEAVQVGEPVSVIGNPLGLDHTLTNGIVSSRRVYEGKRYIQMSAPISPGNSGGPVFDRAGRVIGVSVAQMRGGQNLNLAVPVAQLHALIADDYPNRRSFGASSW